MLPVCIIFWSVPLRAQGSAWTFSRVLRCTDICSLLQCCCTAVCWRAPSPTQWLGGLGRTLGEGGSLNFAPAYVFSASDESSGGQTLTLQRPSAVLFPMCVGVSCLLGSWVSSDAFLCLLHCLCLFRLSVVCSRWIPRSTLSVFNFSCWRQTGNT